MIKANNIQYSYGNLEVLKGVNLHIKKGEFVNINIFIESNNTL